MPADQRLPGKGIRSRPSPLATGGDETRRENLGVAELVSKRGERQVKAPEDPDRTARAQEPAGARSRRWAVVGLALLFAAVGWWAAIVAAGAPRSPAGFLNRDAAAWLGHAWDLENGRLSGRDFVSTYGPVPQLLSLAAVHLHARSDYLSSPPRIDLLFRCFGVALMAIATAFVYRDDARRFAVACLLLWLFGLPDHYTAMRSGAAWLTVVVACRLLLRVPGWRGAFAAGAACVVPELITPDFGIYALAGVAAAVATVPQGRLIQRAANGVSALLGFASGNLVLEVLFAATRSDGAALLGRFVADTWRLMATYSMTVGKAWTLGRLETTLLSVFALGAAFWLTSSAREASPRRRVTLAGLTALGFAMGQGALVRSDPGHVALGLSGLVIALACAIPRGRALASRPLLWALLLLVGMIAWPTRGPKEAWTRLRGLALDPTVAWQRIRLGVAPKSEGRSLPDELIATAGGPADPLFPFPFENYLGAVLGRPLAQRIDQTYKAHNEGLQRVQVRSLERAENRLGVVLRWSRQRIGGLDGVQDVARSALVAEYLLRSFEADPKLPRGDGWLLLRRRREPRVLSPLPLTGRAMDAGPVSGRFELPAPASCTLLVLDVRLAYGWSSVLPLKKQRLDLEVSRGGSPVVATGIVPLSSREPFQILVELSPGAYAASFDSRGEAPSAEFDALTWRPGPSDLVTADLGEIEIERAGCL